MGAPKAQHYAAKVPKCVESVQAWAHKNGYTYSREAMEPQNFGVQCAFTQKVAVMKRFYETLPDGDWLLFLDADIRFWGDEKGNFQGSNRPFGPTEGLDALAARMPLASGRHGELLDDVEGGDECYMIAQTKEKKYGAASIINTVG